LLVVLVPLTVIGFLSTFLMGPAPQWSSALVQGSAAVALLAAYGLSRTRNYYLAAALTIGALAAVPFAGLILRQVYSIGLIANSLVWVALPVLLASLLLPLWGTAIVALASVLGMALLPTVFPDLPVRELAFPIGFVIVIAGLILIADRHRSLLERDRRAELLEANRQLQMLSASLERRVVERTRDLERRARYLEAAAAVARDAAIVLGLPELLSRVVTMINRHFGFYHTAIFLLESSGEWAELSAAAGAGSQDMLARGHRLRVGDESAVSDVIRRGEPRIVLDVGKDAVFFSQPDLPETRSEMALPLRARGEIIGVLDVQSAEPEAFGDEDVVALQTLADQVAVAVSNARLFQQVQESLEAERRFYGEISREMWKDLLRAQPGRAFRRDQHGISIVTDVQHLPIAGAMRTGRTVPDDDDELSLAVPVKVRGQVIGAIGARQPEGAGGWTAEQVALLETLADQLGVALESARLYQDAQRRAAREQLVGEVAARIRETLDMEMVLQTAAQEVRRALGLPEVVIRLTSGADNGAEGRAV